MNTEMTLSEVVELSSNENYNFAREMVDAGKWTKQMMFEYLSSKLNVITEIEIEIEASNEITVNDVLALTNYVSVVTSLGKGLGCVNYAAFSGEFLNIVKECLVFKRDNGRIARYDELKIQSMFIPVHRILDALLYDLKLVDYIA